MGYLSKAIDITKFKRISDTEDKRLVLEAPDTYERRSLLNALKTQRSPLTARVHLSPIGRQNKIIVYRNTAHTDTKIEDRGDELIVIWRKDTQTEVRIDLLKDTAVVEDRI